MDFGDNKQHALEKLFEGENPPVLKAAGIAKILLPNQHYQYVAYTVTFQGVGVQKIEVEEPNPYQISFEQAKDHFLRVVDEGNQ